jgi:ABC-type dipeptide/oligopeptide/nickel transport system ATPase subunit
MDISLSKFDLNTIDRSKKYSIIGRKSTGKSTLVKKIVRCSKHRYGVYITDLLHMKNIYTEIEPVNMYKKYSPLLRNRCFMSHMYLVLDDYPYTIHQLQEIKERLNTVIDFLFIVSYSHYLGIFDYDYVFISSELDDSILMKLHENCVPDIKFNIFKKLVKVCCDSNEMLVINTKNSEDRFMYLERKLVL